MGCDIFLRNLRTSRARSQFTYAYLPNRQALPLPGVPHDLQNSAISVVHYSSPIQYAADYCCSLSASQRCGSPLANSPTATPQRPHTVIFDITPDSPDAHSNGVMSR